MAAVLRMPMGHLRQTVLQVALMDLLITIMDRLVQTGRTMEEPPLELKEIRVQEEPMLLKLPKIEAETFQLLKQLSPRLRTQILMPIGPSVTTLLVSIIHKCLRLQKSIYNFCNNNKMELIK